MPVRSWRCGECGIVLPDDLDVESHFLGHPVPPAARPTPRCSHAPLLVDVSPKRVYLWMSAGDVGDSSLGLHAGWTRRGTPSVVREIVERENAASLATPGWYYPHTAPSAQALDALYHQIVLAEERARAPQHGGIRTGPPSPAPGMPFRSSALRRNPKAKRRLVASVELIFGIVTGVLGSNLMYLCTGTVPFDGCGERAYGFPGFALLFVGICVGLYGLGSLIATVGKEVRELPPDWHPGGPRASPEVEAEAEHLATIVWGAILMAILVAAEAFPIYNLVVLTSSGARPTFNLGAFLVDMVLFGIADAFIVFLAVTYGANN